MRAPTQLAASNVVDRLAMASLALLPACGIFVSGVLTLHAFQGGALPCGASTGCEAVTGSPLASLGPVPIAAVGLASFVALLVTGITKAAPLGYFLSAVSSLVSLGLLGYSTLVIRGVCYWCLASACLFLLILASHAWLASRPVASNALRIPWSLPVALALAGFGASAFVGGTGGWTQPKHNVGVLRSVSLDMLVPSDSVSEGPADAKQTYLLIADLQCRICLSLLPRLRKAVLSQPSSRLIVRHFPLDKHDASLEAAVAAEKARKTIGFWSFIEGLAGADKVSIEVVLNHATAAGLNVDTIGRSRLLKDADVQRVMRDKAFAREVGLSETPVLFRFEGHRREVVDPESVLGEFRKR